MANSNMNVFAPYANASASHTAHAVLRLLNSSPRTPTADEIARAIAESTTDEVGFGFEVAKCIRDYEAAKEALEDYRSKAPARDDCDPIEYALDTELERVEREILAAPASTWADVAIKARIAKRHENGCLSTRLEDFGAFDEMTLAAVLRAALEVGGDA